MGVADRWAGAPVLSRDDDGMTLIQVSTKEHLQQLSDDQANCAYAHAYWSDGMRTEPLEQFFVYVDKDGKARATFHCKSAEWMGKVHPMDGTEEQREATAFIGGDVYSTRYETEYSIDPDKSQAAAIARVKEAEAELADRKNLYETCKQQALKHMALGKDNPLKGELDARNRIMSAAKEDLADAQFAASLYEGIRFVHCGEVLCLLAYVTRGYYKDSISRNRYTEGFAAFLGGKVV